MARWRRVFWLCLWAALAGVAVTGVVVAEALAAGVPGMVFQDNDRSYRNRAQQPGARQAAPRVSTAPQGLPLGNYQRPAQAAQVRANVAQGQGVLPQGPNGPQLQLQAPDSWRLRVREAAGVQGGMVTVGDIMDPVGDIPLAEWEALRVRQLWPAPEDMGKPLQVNKNRLRQALREVLGKQIADRCLTPGSLAIQRGGLVVYEHDLRNYVVSYLTPQMQSMPGQADISDFRLPPYVFLAHPQQRIGLETGRVLPGRVTLRFVVQEPDGSVVRRVAGAIFLDLWMDVPAAARPMNKGEPLNVQDVTFIRMNAAQLKNMPWDGRGGPWQLNRNVVVNEPIFQSDLSAQAMVHKGDMVELLYHKGNLSLSVQAEALQDGEPGASISVRNLQSKKQVLATVRDAKTVLAQ